MSDEIIDPCRFTWRTDRDARGRGPWCLEHRDYVQSGEDECRVAVLLRERDEARRFAEAMRRYAMVVFRGGLELQAENKTLWAQFQAVRKLADDPAWRFVDKVPARVLALILEALDGSQ